MLKTKGVQACSKVFWCSSINNFLILKGYGCHGGESNAPVLSNMSLLPLSNVRLTFSYLIFCVLILIPIVIRCPVLLVENAEPPTGVCTSPSLEYGTRCTFTCRAGYRLRGCKERVCQLDKSWSGNPTICEGTNNTPL